MRHIAIALTLIGTPAAAIDPCLVGTWRADIARVADDMAAVMNTTLGGGVSATALGGDVSLRIDEGGTALMQTDDMRLEVVPPGQPKMTIEVDGYSTAALSAEDGSTFSTTVTDYALTGSAEFLGQRMELPFDAASGLGGASRGSYSCDGDSLTFTPDQQGTMPSRWSRLR